MSKMNVPKVIIDCDPGTDDAWALIMLIQAWILKKIDICAITCVNGNTSLNNIVNNVFRILQLFKNADIPVFKGADIPLTEHSPDHHVNITYHGADGLGDVFDENPDIDALKDKNAINAIVEIVNQNKGEVTLLCLGPLTNIAHVIQRNPNFSKAVKQLIIMGGNISGIGNAGPYAEFNFYVDPKSAFLVFNKIDKEKLWLVPWETCFKCQIPSNWVENVCKKISSPYMEFLKKVESGAFNTEDKISKHYLCDPVASSVFLVPSIIKEEKLCHLNINVTNDCKRGQATVDPEKEPNCHVVLDIDKEIFKMLLLLVADSNEYGHILKK